MNFSQDWKSYFPVSPSHAPLLVPDSKRPVLGPLIFNPNPQTLTQLFSSSSLLPPPIHTHQLSLPQFLANSPGSSITPSIASSIALQSGSQFQPQDELLSALRYNQLETLKYRNGVLLFFPTGENFERVGYLMLHIEGSGLHVKLDGNDDIFQVSSGVSQRISRILINPIDDGSESCIIGYLLVSTCYAVHWFSVCDDSYFERPRVVHKGSKTFKTCSVVHACWSSHIIQESLVLLTSGDLFLFDLGDEHIQVPTNFKGTKLKINWPDSACSRDAIWVSCEFSWHARIFIVATSHMIFLVDWRDDTCMASCLLKTELLHVHTQAQNEHFLALSRAGPDNFYFTVASNNFLLLCDVRKPMFPIIRWAHDLDNPTYINVVNLFQLRSHSREDTFESVSKVGFCIMLGSFYNGIFNFFCYGPLLPSKERSFASKFSKTNKTFYAWELPYEVAISGHYCRCGSCLLTEELSKQDLPEWVDWRMKKDMVLGFSIMNNHLASLLCEPDEYGGFTLLRLMTSGRIEFQRYQASWLTEKKLKNCNGQGMLLNKYLFSVDDEKYELSKSHVFVKRKYLFSYFRGDFTELLVGELKGIGVRDKKSLDIEVHEALCKKLNACGVGSARSSPTAFFKDVELSASLYEIALRGLWAKLPLDILQLAFSKDPEYSASSMEFLAVPPLNKLPPFFLRKPSPRSNKCSKKVKGSSKKDEHNDMVGPILPLAFLLGLHEFYYGSSDVSLETKVRLQCEEVMKVAGKICVLAHDFAVSPDDDAGGKWLDSSRPKHFLLYQPVLFDRPASDLHRNFTDQYKIHHTLISNVLEKKTICNEKFKSVGQGSSTELSSNSPIGKFGSCDSRMYNLLESHMSKW